MGFPVMGGRKYAIVNYQLHIQEMELLLEEEFLDVLLALARSLPVQDIWQAGGGNARSAAQQAPSAEDSSKQELQVRVAELR